MRLPLTVLAVCVLAGCTPTRSTIAPPYVVDNIEYSPKELDAYANQACKVASNGLPLPPRPFTTDGCSLYKDSGWRGCCIKHDVAYWCGAVVRRDADRAFRACVQGASSKSNANLMYGGVRLGGWRLLPFPWRFGYGRAWPQRAPNLRNHSTAAASRSAPLPPITCCSPSNTMNSCFLPSRVSSASMRCD